MHRIRLRRPWIKQSADQSDRKVDVPDLEAADHQTADPQSNAAGEVTYRRAFNRPSGLDDQSQVHLRISDWSGKIAVDLNGTALPCPDPSPPLCVEIGTALQDHNQLTVRLLPIGDFTGVLSGEVQLEIQSAP